MALLKLHKARLHPGFLTLETEAILLKILILSVRLRVFIFNK